MLINIPIEPIPMRYSYDWNIWFKNYFTKQKINFITIYGNELTKGIEQGRFLDCIGTNYYKSSQLIEILNLIQNKTITKGDILFFHDLWFPGIEQIKYVSDTLNLELKFTGCLHAGCYDPNDFLYQSNTGNWAIHFEHMLFSMVDLIFVATYYHKNLLQKSRSLNYSKIKVTGFPIFPQNSIGIKKKNIVVFPHRLDSEKNPELFFEIKNRFKNESEWEFISTVQKKLAKDEYYNLLDQSKISISFSDQETWGIAMIESVFAGCLPLVPNKLSYKELYLEFFTYKTIFEFESKLIDFMKNYSDYSDLLQKQQKFLIKGGKKAISKILTELERIY